MGGGGGELIVDRRRPHPSHLSAALSCHLAFGRRQIPVNTQRQKEEGEKEQRVLDRLVIFIIKITGDLPLSGSPTSDSEK